ncbi:MAG: archaeosortase/exosortase family protein [Candidatus Binatia bacterium]|nr:archaeosortase/exosortase family protein [Candidatus Binatia bacterium]
MLWRWLREQWLVIRVVGTFLAVILLVFFATDYAPLADRLNVAAWMAQFATWASAIFLRVLGSLLGFTLSVEGTRLSANGFAVDVTEACSGVVPTAIYSAAVLAYPASWVSRCVGLVLGAVVIHALNVLRVVGLFLVGLFANPYFHYTHVYLAQAMIIVVAVATWLYWAQRFVHVAGR